MGRSGRKGEMADIRRIIWVKTLVSKGECWEKGALHEGEREELEVSGK